MHELFRARRRKTNVNIALKEAGETDDIFYTSRTNERLHDEHTGLYLMSDLYIVDEVIRELRNEARAETK